MNIHIPDSKAHLANMGPTYIYRSCRPQVGPMLAPCTLLSGLLCSLLQQQLSQDQVVCMLWNNSHTLLWCSNQLICHENIPIEEIQHCRLVSVSKQRVMISSSADLMATWYSNRKMRAGFHVYGHSCYLSIYDGMADNIYFFWHCSYYTPRQLYPSTTIPLDNFVVEGILVSLRPSVRPSRIPCSLCSTYSSGWIHFILIHLIKRLQKVCRV